MYTQKHNSKIRPSARSSACPSARPCARASVRPSFRPSVRPSVRPSYRLNRKSKSKLWLQKSIDTLTSAFCSEINNGWVHLAALKGVLGDEVPLAFARGLLFKLLSLQCMPAVTLIVDDRELERSSERSLEQVMKYAICAIKDIDQAF